MSRRSFTEGLRAFSRHKSVSPLPATRVTVVAVAAPMILSGCSTTDGPDVGVADVTDSTVAVTGTVTTVDGSVSGTTASLATVSTTTVSTTTTPSTAPASSMPIPDGYPISHPPGGDVTDVTEENENISGTDQLVTRVEVWYDGDRFEEFAMFYLNWIVENEYFIVDSLTNEDEGRFIIRGGIPPDDDTYYTLTVVVIGDSTTVGALWARPPD